MYMAPEVVEAVYFHEDSRNIPACDVWSFGVVLYLLLAGMAARHARMRRLWGC